MILCFPNNLAGTNTITLTIFLFLPNSYKMFSTDEGIIKDRLSMFKQIKEIGGYDLTVYTD